MMPAEVPAVVVNVASSAALRERAQQSGCRVSEVERTGLERRCSCRRGAIPLAGVERDRGGIETSAGEDVASAVTGMRPMSMVAVPPVMLTVPPDWLNVPVAPSRSR